jgi:hypothetical protein
MEGDGYFTVGSPAVKRAVCASDPYPEISNEEVQANARLIAASPELLAACEESLKHMESCNTPSGYRLELALKAAIAKATGK